MNTLSQSSSSCSTTSIEAAEAAAAIASSHSCCDCGSWICTQTLVRLYWEHEFLILVLCSIALAYAYPPLGAIYVAPDITASWIVVMFIFFMAGLSLKTSEFKNALQQVYFNAFVQVFNFGVVSAAVFGVSRLLIQWRWIGVDLANGMTIGACVPMTINMVLVMTKAAGGDEAAAIFNAAIGNLIGIFLSPALMLAYIGVSGSVNVIDVFYKLVLRVVVPVIIGQVLQYYAPRIPCCCCCYATTTNHRLSWAEWLQQNKNYIRPAQQYALVFIVYTVFCKQFYGNRSNNDDEENPGVASIFLMIAFTLILLVCLMLLAWLCLRMLFFEKPELRIMGLFGCTHKTVAMGLSLIASLYEDSPNVGYYTLPLLVWHTLQLLLGSFLAPHLHQWVLLKKNQQSSSQHPSTTPSQSQSSSSSSHSSIIIVIDPEEPLQQQQQQQQEQEEKQRLQLVEEGRA